MLEIEASDEITEEKSDESEEIERIEEIGINTVQTEGEFETSENLLVRNMMKNMKRQKSTQLWKKSVVLRKQVIVKIRSLNSLSARVQNHLILMDKI